MKITKNSTMKFTNVLVEGVEVGQIKLNAEVQIMTYGDSEDCDFELIDWKDITYMGMQVDNTSELFKFHKTLGIDLHSEIQKAVDKVFTEEVLEELLED